MKFKPNPDFMISFNNNENKNKKISKELHKSNSNQTFNRTVDNPDVSTNGAAIVSGYSETGSAGTMTAGVPASGVTQTFIANVISAGSYSITTSANGVTFVASGIFTETGNQEITLTASGTPTEVGTYTYTSNTNPNASFTRTAVINPSSNGTANISSYNSSTPSGTIYLENPVSGVQQTVAANVTTSGSYSINEGFMNWKVDQLSVDYRHTHIAYCTFFNNTPYEKIENPRKDHKPNTSSLYSLRKFWESQIEVENEKAVCDCA
jgi:hypothetical protein